MITGNFITIYYDGGEPLVDSHESEDARETFIAKKLAEVPSLSIVAARFEHIYTTKTVVEKAALNIPLVPHG